MFLTSTGMPRHSKQNFCPSPGQEVTGFMFPGKEHTMEVISMGRVL